MSPVGALEQILYTVEWVDGKVLTPVCSCGTGLDYASTMNLYRGRGNYDQKEAQAWRVLADVLKSAEGYLEKCKAYPKE